MPADSGPAITGSSRNPSAVLEAGVEAPDFTLPDETGRLVHLAEVRERGPVLLFFYPADFTPGCTREVCALRDVHTPLVVRSVTVLGVSPQGSQSHYRFRERYQLPFRLLADPSRAVIRAYRCAGPLGFVRRTSYLVASGGRIVESVRADFRIARHRDFALRIGAVTRPEA